jgi:hypothetical protein
MAFAGPALLVSVGYMDPGNWATDLEGGASYKYGLLWVVALSSLMAIVLQICAARLGVVTGKDLAQASRDFYPAWTRWPNWIACELAIGACDLAEVLGSAVAINLLFHIPLFWAVILTAFDVLLLLALQGMGMRFIEAIILVLVATIGGCYFIEIFVLPQTHPSFTEMGRALMSPGFRREGMLVGAIGIIGARAERAIAERGHRRVALELVELRPRAAERAGEEKEHPLHDQNSTISERPATVGPAIGMSLNETGLGAGGSTSRSRGASTHPFDGGSGSLTKL